MINSKYFLLEHKNYANDPKNRIFQCPPIFTSMTYEQTSMFNQLHREIETLRFEMDKKDETIKQCLMKWAIGLGLRLLMSV